MRHPALHSISGGPRLAKSIFRRRGSFRGQHVDGSCTAQERLRTHEPHSRRFTMIDAQDAGEYVVQVNDPAAYHGADWFCSGGPPGDFRRIGTEQSCRRIRTKRVDDPGQKRLNVRQGIRRWTQDDAIGDSGFRGRGARRRRAVFRTPMTNCMLTGGKLFRGGTAPLLNQPYALRVGFLRERNRLYVRSSHLDTWR